MPPSCVGQPHASMLRSSLRHPCDAAVSHRSSVGAAFERRQAAGARAASAADRASRASVTGPANAGTAAAAPPPPPPLPTLSDASTVPYKLMAGLASAGAAETSYLLLSKLLHAEVACPTEGCASVLSSPYAELFGVPLPLWGMLAYGGVAALAVTGDNWEAAGTGPPRALNAVLLAGCGVLASTSGALMYVLHTALAGAPCVYCYASAGISFALLACMAASLERRSLADAAAPGLGAVVATFTVLYMGYGSALAQGSADLELPYAPPAVTAASSARAVDLAARLRAAGAKMYGAFWCSHCFDQKQAFGRQAMDAFPYVECYPEGWRRGVQIDRACDAADIKAFPTWIINGTALEGELDFDTLEAALSAPPLAADSTNAAAAPEAASVAAAE